MKILLFREHKGDLLAGAIAAITRGQYTHAAILTDEAKLEIHEAYYPSVHKRILTPDELPGIDVFELEGITPVQEALALAYYEAHIGNKYSILDLERFFPFVRAVFGDENAAAAQQHCFCSMYAFDGVVAASYFPLLRVEGYEVCPNVLGYSPRLLQTTWAMVEAALLTSLVKPAEVTCTSSNL